MTQSITPRFTMSIFTETFHKTNIKQPKKQIFNNIRPLKIPIYKYILIKNTG